MISNCRYFFNNTERNEKNSKTIYHQRIACGASIANAFFKLKLIRIFMVKVKFIYFRNTYEYIIIVSLFFY